MENIRKDLDSVIAKLVEMRKSLGHAEELITIPTLSQFEQLR